MFSLLADGCCSHPNCIEAQKRGAPKPSIFLDAAGIITLIVLGALAATGMGGEVVNSLNTISGLPIGGWVMIGGGILASLIVCLQNRPTAPIE